MMATYGKQVNRRRSRRLSLGLGLAVLLLLFCQVPMDLPAAGPSRAVVFETKIKGFFPAALGDLKVLMPEAGRGTNILLPLTAGESLPAITTRVKNILGCHPARTAGLVLLKPVTDDEKGLVAQFPDLRLFVLNGLLPPGIQSRFNRKLDFGGPNCFFTALVTTNGIEPGETRHVGLNEFKARLALLYTEIATTSPEPGDVLLFNSSDHGATYVGGDRVFHKKDLNKEYYFRMPRLREVFESDPGEWVPGPNYCGPYSRPGDTTIRKVQVFRRNQTPLAAWSASVKTRPECRLIHVMKAAAMKTAPAWSLGKIMGYWSEVLSEELVRAFDAPLKTDENGKRLMTELESVRDQIFIAIEDGYFSSPYANQQKIMKEIWFFDNEYARTLITSIRDCFGQKTDEAALVRISAALQAIAGDPRGKSLLAIIRSDH